MEDREIPEHFELKSTEILLLWQIIPQIKEISDLLVRWCLVQKVQETLVSMIALLTCCIAHIHTVVVGKR